MNIEGVKRKGGEKNQAPNLMQKHDEMKAMLSH